MRKSVALVLALALVGQALATDDLLAWKAQLFHKLAISGAPTISGAPLTPHQELHALLFGGAPATPTQVPVNCQSAAAIAAGNSNFTTLVAAAQAAGLASALSNAGLQATVFAPTNAAFAALLQALGVTPAQLLANTNLLASVLKYHVIPTPMTAAQLAAQSSAKLPTLLDKHYLTPSVLDVYSHFGMSQALYMIPEASSPAQIIQADINAGCPTIVHVIDGVLVPAQDPTAAAAQATAQLAQTMQAMGL